MSRICLFVAPLFVLLLAACGGAPEPSRPAAPERPWGPPNETLTMSTPYHDWVSAVAVHLGRWTF